jgi:hypothetical protein
MVSATHGLVGQLVYVLRNLVQMDKCMHSQTGDIVIVIKHLYSAIKSEDSEALCYRSWDKLKSAIK